MFDKKKLHFWQLFVIYSSITILALVYAWKINPAEQVSMPMMQNSMGSMMQMHLKEATIADLIKPSEQMQQASQSGEDMSSHHAQEPYLKLVHQLTTVTIVILLPLIIAGTIFLAIIWVK